MAVTDELGVEIAAANRRWMEAYASRDVDGVAATTLLGDGSEALDHFNYMVIWRRSSGELLIHREIWNSRPAPADG